MTCDRTLLMALVVFAISASIGCRNDVSPQPSSGATPQSNTEPESAVAQLQLLIQSPDLSAARELCKQLLISFPNDPDVLTHAATIAALSDEKREAAMLMVEAAKHANFQPASRILFAIQACVDVGEIYTAIDLLEASLAVHPDQSEQRKMLVGFLNEVQRTERIPSHLQILIERRQFNIALLLATTDTATRRLSDTTGSDLLRRNPNDRRVRLVDAFVLMYERDAARACDVLEDILKHHPEFAPAHAMYGQSIAANLRWADLATWYASAPTNSVDFADYWLTLGDWQAYNGVPEEAVRAYWEATRRDPNRLAAWDRLRLTLQRLTDGIGNSDGPDSVPFPIDAKWLERINRHSAELLTLSAAFNEFAAGGGQSQQRALNVARSLLALGRTWEAEAWSAAASTLTLEPSPGLASMRNDIVNRLRRDPSWFAKDTVEAIDLSFWPLPRPEFVSDPEAAVAVLPLIQTNDHLRLSEQRESWKLSQISVGNTPSGNDRNALVRFTGVGAGAIDYDRDGRVDLMAIGAGGTMLDHDSQANELLRNHGSEFSRVTDSARVGDRGFGQGVAVGDFNEDGFADLLFANLGQNRLLRNNGDGTFSDCTSALLPILADSWSTSAAIVDLNADALADIVVSCYCSFVEGIDKPCFDELGRSKFCHPLSFPAAPDHWFLGTPSGSFEKAEAKQATTAGRGLAILAGCLTGGTDVGVYVANDMTQNSYFSFALSDPPTMQDESLARGIALDGRSQPQASMGIAASDFDLDGDLDLYVTGFAREYNVYYEQLSPGLWIDSTSRLGLIEPTLMMVGFGTQAIDLDSDGIDEIIVTNGHVGDDLGPNSPPYEQPLQVFRRGNRGAFVLVNDDAWGDYFRASHVGRALLTADFNRDGRADAVVTHASEPVGLLINETRTTNHRIGFQLTATRSSRDGVGAVVRFVSAGQQKTQWLLSGDGYLCSNDKTLLAGLGDNREVTDVEVTWRDGTTTRFGTLKADRQYLLVQEAAEAFMLAEYP